MSEKIQPTDPRIATAQEIINEARGRDVIKDEKRGWDLYAAQNYIDRGLQEEDPTSGSHNGEEAFYRFASFSGQQAFTRGDYDRAEEIKKLIDSL